MAEQYTVKSTSSHSAKVEDRVLGTTETTKTLLRPQVVDNPNIPHARIKIALVHQRKKRDNTWEDEPSPPLSSMKAGEVKKFSLDCAKTLKLFEELKNLYAIGETTGVPFGQTKLVVAPEEELIRADASRSRVIRSLLQKDYSEEIWRALIEDKPDLATKFALARIQSERLTALSEFEANLTKDRNESWWQCFFELNTWIFGYGLNYRVLKQIAPQPSYGGTDVRGRGSQRGDYLHRTEAEKKFTVLLEIKRPDTPLLGNSEYRSGAWRVGEDLVGGVSQLQVNCRQWESSGSRTEENRELLVGEGVFTVQPKGILVVGGLSQLDSLAKRNTFELFRRNTVNPEVLTFDELLERARFICQQRSADTGGK